MQDCRNERVARPPAGKAVKDIMSSAAIISSPLGSDRISVSWADDDDDPSSSPWIHACMHACRVLAFKWRAVNSATRAGSGLDRACTAGAEDL